MILPLPLRLRQSHPVRLRETGTLTAPTKWMPGTFGAGSEMNKLSLFLFLFVFLYVAEPVMGRGAKDDSKPVEVTGMVRMVGSSPLTVLVISGENREWYIEPEEAQKLAHLQQQIVTVKASEYYEEMVLANGLSAGKRYHLKNITVISPK